MVCAKETRLICRGFENNVINVEIITWTYVTKQLFIQRIQSSPPENEGYPFKFIHKQLLICLCFVMTIKNSSQTIHTIELYFLQHVFSHEHLYVALSRKISMTKTKVLVIT